MKRISSKSEYFKWGLTAFLVVAASILFYMILQHGGVIARALAELARILSPIIWGLVIAYLLWPLTKFFERELFRPLAKKLLPKRDGSRLARALSIVLSIVLALLLIGVLLWLIIPQVYSSVESIVSNASDYYSTVSEWIGRFFEDYPEVEQVLLEATGNVSDSLIDWARTAVLPYLSTMVSNVSTGIFTVLKGILNVLIGFVVACYILANVELFGAKSKKILYSIFSIPHAENVLKAVRFTDGAFNGFITGKIIDSLIIGVLCYLGCLVLKMPYAMLVSVIVGVTNIIPVFGPFIGAIPSAMLILIVSPIKCLIFVAFIIVLQQIDGNIIWPKILGSSIGVNGFWIMFSILLGGGLFGVIGMVLAVPMFAVVYAGVGKLVESGLKRRGLQTETAAYLKIDAIDPETKRPVRAEAAEAAPEKPSAKDGK